MTTPAKGAARSGRLRPRITLAADEHERLSALANAAMNTMPDVAGYLADELDRAQVLVNGRQPTEAVRMGCEVEFRDDATGKAQTVTLVYPGEADISQGKVSVLTPIGAALIGVHVGQAISWETRGGELKRLTVLHVREPQPA